MSREHEMRQESTTEAPADPERPALEALDRDDFDEALNIVMNLYGRPIYRYCCQMMKDEHLAEDVLQETFVQVHRDLPGFARRSSLKTWVYAIAHHRCLDAIKKEKRRQRRIEWTDDPPERADGSPGADRILAAKRRAEALRRCIEELKESARAAVISRLQAGMSYPEMSVVFGEAPATLQMRVTRALPLLQECIERKGVRS